MERIIVSRQTKKELNHVDNTSSDRNAFWL